MFKYFNSLSTLRNIYICINYKGKNRNEPKYFGEIITTGENRKNFQ